MIARIGVFGCLLLATSTLAARAETLVVGLDQAEVLRLDQPANTIIIGNPAIADALVQTPELLVVTGKSFGTTNLIVLDTAGEQIEEYRLHVGSAGNDIVTIQRGSTRFSYSCNPTCNTTLLPGDETETYKTVQGQVESRIGLSRAQSAE